MIPAKTNPANPDQPHFDLRSFADGLSDAFCVVDVNLNVLFANPVLESFINKSDSPEDFLKSTDLVEHLQSAFKNQKGFTLHDRKLNKNSEHTHTIEIHTFEDPAYTDGLASIRILNRDKESAVAERMKRGDQIRRLSMIAAGLAHEIRNPLFAIQGAADLLVKKGPLTESEVMCLDIIKKESERINKLVGELMDLSKPKTMEFTEININALIHDILHSLRLTSSESLKIRDDIDPSLPPILGDAVILHQALNNIIKNAIEALKGSGTVHVRSQYVTDFTLRTEDGKRKFLCVSIEDDGPGMSEDELKNIFTPYYTTKSKGTGLGLAIAQQAIEHHGGRILVKSRQGQGSIFNIYLPIHL